MGEIYGLISTRPRPETASELETVRYVGKSIDCGQKRFWDHLKYSKAESKVARWVREEHWCGYEIECITIEAWKQQDLIEREPNWLRRREKYWMNCFPMLLNERDYNHYANTVSKEDSDKVLEILRRSFYPDNWRGYVGIRYGQQLEWNGDGWKHCWGVSVYDPFGRLWGYWHEFLDFDEAFAYRQESRDKANKSHIQRFGVALPWPPDMPDVPGPIYPDIQLS